MSKIIDTRTFGQIYDSLQRVEQYDLRERIRKVSMVTEPTIRNWKNGFRKPEVVHQVNVCKVLKQLFGIESSPKYLFPEK